MSSIPIPQGATIADAPKPAVATAVPIPADALVESEAGKGVLTPEDEASRTRMQALSGMTGMPTPGMSDAEKKEFEAGKAAGHISADATIAATTGAASPQLAATIGTAAGTAVRLARTPAGQYLIKRGLDLAGLGLAYKLADKFLGK